MIYLLHGGKPPRVPSLCNMMGMPVKLLGTGTHGIIIPRARVGCNSPLGRAHVDRGVDRRGDRGDPGRVGVVSTVGPL